MFEEGKLRLVFRGARTSLHHRRKKLIVEKRPAVVLENFIRDIQSTAHPDEHAQLPLIVLLHKDNAFRPLCQHLKLLGAERPEIPVVQIRDLPSSQFIAAHDVLKYLTGTSPTDREQLDFVACIHPIGSLYAATADMQMRSGKPRF